MVILQSLENSHNYKLLDSGNGQRLEQFGALRVIRPDVTCIWQPRDKSMWAHVDLICSKNAIGGGYHWGIGRSDTPFEYAQDMLRRAQSPWLYTYYNTALAPLHFILRTSPESKNIGIFPEQAVHWDWMVEKIKTAVVEGRQPNILNLFAYTGGATVIAAAAGAQVCHVDAAKTTVTWARQNAEANGLQDAPIRWMVEDCLTFMEREIKRGKKYDGIIMDPPAFGRDPRGKTFSFESAVHQLLAVARDLLKSDGFLTLNVYSVPLYATHLANVVYEYFPGKQVIAGELHLKDVVGGMVPCNIFVRVD